MITLNMALASYYANYKGHISWEAMLSIKEKN